MERSQSRASISTPFVPCILLNWFSFYFATRELDQRRLYLWFTHQGVREYLISVWLTGLCFCQTHLVKYDYQRNQLGFHCTAFVRCNSWSGLDYSAVNYKRYKNDFNQELSSIQPPVPTGYCTQQEGAIKFCYIVNLHLSFFTLGFLCHINADECLYTKFCMENFVIHQIYTVLWNVGTRVQN